ncbi:MAG: thioredoxin domain-containing protein [Sphingomonadaceae bacterium]|nr:thioredoxin domain-containing protein [Sphingomonadaceae bacterium]
MKTMFRVSGIVIAMALAACGSETPTTGNAANAQVDTSRDWTQTVSATEAGGFVIGNPDAPVKLIEYASLTCPHCAAFSEQGYGALSEEYIKRGLVSYEIRNFVLNPVDLGATILSRCNGAEPYFALTERIFANQDAMMQAAQNADPAQMQAIQSLPREQQPARFAEVVGLVAFVGGLGIPEARARECLADPSAIQALQRLSETGRQEHNVQGTPTFVINGEVETANTWPAIKVRLDEELR